MLIAANSTAALAFFLGSWTCRRGGPHPRVRRVAVSTSVGGTWLRADSYSSRSIDPKRPFYGAQYLGYSAVSKRYVAMNVNNFGGYWIEESRGWNGKRLVWRQPGSGTDGELGITTITKLSPNSYRVHVEVLLNGKPEPPQPDDVCTRAP